MRRYKSIPLHVLLKEIWMINLRRIAATLCCGALILAASGCGSKVPVGSSGPNAKSPDGLVAVKGVVTIDGNPTEGVRLTIMEPEELKKTVAAQGYPHGPSATTNAKGEFAISTVKPGDGALPGKYLVYFEWFPGGVGSYFDDPSVPVKPEIAAKFPPGVMPFYNKYKAGGPGNIELTIEAGKPQTDLKFDLTTKK